MENVFGRTSGRRWASLITTTTLSTIVVPGGLLVAVPYLLLRPPLAGSDFDPGALGILGAVTIAAGGAVLAWCVGDFLVFGGGTPNPADPPRNLVARGPYRRLRNPMYLAMGIIVAGEALLFGSTALLGYLVVIMVLLHVFVVSFEEPRLRRQFGSTYDDYCQRVPRWIPRL